MGEAISNPDVGLEPGNCTYPVTLRLAFEMQANQTHITAASMWSLVMPREHLRGYMWSAQTCVVPAPISP